MSYDRHRLPNAPEEYSRDEEDRFRSKLEELITNATRNIAGMSTGNGQINLSQNDLKLANGANDNLPLVKSTYVRLIGPTADFSISGIAGGAVGCMLVIRNTTNKVMTIINEGAGSAAANRILTPRGTNLVLSGVNGESVRLVYDIGVQRWIVEGVSVNAAGGVTTADIADGAVTTPKIADAAVTTPKIADANVTTSKIADSNVTTSKIANGNVTTSKIADSNVTYSKIQNVSAPALLLGRKSAGAGAVEEITRGDLLVSYAYPGMMMMWPATWVPGGWLERNGAPISRVTYADLFAVIGTVFGAGDGVNTFNLPDDRGVFERGWDHGRGLDAGRVFGSYQDDAFQGHTHQTVEGQVRAYVGSGGGGANPAGSAVKATSLGPPLAYGSWGTPRNDDETRAKNRAYLPIIKY